MNQEFYQVNMNYHTHRWLLDHLPGMYLNLEVEEVGPTYLTGPLADLIPSPEPSSTVDSKTLEAQAPPARQVSPANLTPPARQIMSPLDLRSSTIHEHST